MLVWVAQGKRTRDGMHFYKIHVIPDSETAPRVWISSLENEWQASAQESSRESLPFVLRLWTPRQLVAVGGLLVHLHQSAEINHCCPDTQSLPRGSLCIPNTQRRQALKLECQRYFPIQSSYVNRGQVWLERHLCHRVCWHSSSLALAIGLFSSPLLI